MLNGRWAILRVASVCLALIANVASVDRQHAFIGYSEKNDSGFTPEKCMDTNKACSDWASNGECDKNPSYMFTDCKASCGLCSDSQATEKTSYIIVHTNLASFKIKLRPDIAPITVAWLQRAIEKGLEQESTLYRAESMTDGYGLVQGGFKFKGNIPNLSVEQGLGSTRGVVCLIAGTLEFFVNLVDHPEWDLSFTGFGEVNTDGLDLLERIITFPVRKETHPTYGTVMQMLIDPIKFTVSLEEEPMTNA